MRIRSKILIVFMLLISGPVFAQEIAGTWQGKLVIATNQTLTIQFALTKRPDGSYAAVLNSPDNGGIKNVAANAVTWNAGALKIDVAALSGSYAGVYKNGNFDGQWTQPGGPLPLNLSPYQKPQLSKDAIKTLLGGWHGPVTIPGGTLTFVLRFKVDDKGVLQGALAVPEQGGVELPMSDIEFTNNKLTFSVPVVKGKYAASYAKEKFTGNWSQGGTELPVTLTKGDVASPVIALKLSKDAYAAIAGKWQGKLQLPQRLLAVVLRIETNSKGQYVGYLDNPELNVNGLPVTEVTLNAGKFTVKLEKPPAEYSGTLSGKTLTGQWVEGAMNISLTLTKQ